MGLNHFSATVDAAYPLTPRAKQLLLRVDDHTFDYAPGQHVTVLYEDDEEGRAYRPYSPINRPGTNQLVLAVKRYPNGTCSTWLHERTEGDTVPLTAPSGNLYLRDPDRDVLFLCTGTGLTPMIAMLTQYLQNGSGRAGLLFGERTAEDLMYRETLDLLSASHDALTVEYVLSDTDWTGPTGYVQEHLDPFLSDPEHVDVYVCGVPEMVVDTQTVLQNAGVPEEHIFTEGWEQGAVEH